MHLNSAQIERSSIIWVLVANGARAQIYRYHQHDALMPMPNTKRKSDQQVLNHRGLTPVPDLKFKAESLDDFHVGHDSRGSKIGGARPGHNTCEPHLDIHDEIKHNLVKAIGDKLKQACESKAFDCLVIAASPKILGALRLYLDAAVLSHVIAEINKDFSNDNNHALLVHLQKTLTEAHIS